MGIIGVALGAAAAAISALTALRLAPRFSSFRDVESNLHFFAEILWVNVALLICFSVFLSAAIAYRNRPALHKRLILLASLSFMPPAVTRIIDWPIWGFGNNAYFPLLCCLVGMIAALGLHDFAQRRAVHPVTLIGGSALAVLFAIGAFLMPATEIGRSVVYELYLLMR
ncbi:MAG TPA: hypothetical protein VFV95_02595 [Vicinamibacterales bacterium]|nr:hypothetical protein [Vicinamibacterales bacterium]